MTVSTRTPESKEADIVTVHSLHDNKVVKVFI